MIKIIGKLIGMLFKLVFTIIGMISKLLFKFLIYVLGNMYNITSELVSGYRSLKDKNSNVSNTEEIL